MTSHPDPAGSVKAKLPVTTAVQSAPSQGRASRPARWKSCPSSHAAIALSAMTTPRSTHRGAPATIKTTAGIRTAALNTRWRSMVTGRVVRREIATAPTSHPAETARAALILGDGPVEIDLRKVRPEDRGDPQLRVGDLPQEEIRDPHLPAGPDEEIRIRHVSRVERLGDVLLADLLGIELARAHLAREGPHGIEQLVAAAVVERHQQGRPGVVRGRPHHAIDATLDTRRHSMRPSEDA